MKKLFLFFVFLLSMFEVFSDNEDERKVVIGIYVEAVDHIDFNAGSCYVEFWIWANYSKHYFEKKGIRPLHELNVLNCPDVKTDGETDFTIDSTGKMWAIQKYRLTVYQDWEAKGFPLDQQTITLQFELPEYDKDLMQLEIDEENSVLDSSVYSYLNHHGWKFEEGSKRLKLEAKKIKTNLGNQISKTHETTHKLMTLQFGLSRTGSRIFLKIFLIMYVSLFMAMLVFLMDKELIDARISMVIGGLFGAIGNKYIIDSEIPHSPIMTLTDALHNVTFVYLFVILLIVIMEYQDKKRIASMGESKVKKLNMLVFGTLVVSYTVLNVVIVKLW